ncbi:MAG: imidazolonepropionase [Acidobacteriota bacterium]|jgi:imidazolonepropionase|nr:imidazolonepropionase [Acidobacteriota bacterium]
MSEAEEREETLAVVNCSQLVTLAGPRRPRVGTEMRELSIIEDGALLVRGGRIERTGRRAEIEPLISEERKVFDAGGRVVMPGFVDAHAHPVFAGHRADEFEKRAAGASYQEIAASGGGIRSTVRRTRAADTDELFDAALRREAWFLRTGTTTVEAKSGYGLSVEDELKMLRVVRRLNTEGRVSYVPTFLGAHEVPDEYHGRRDEYVRLVVEEMLPRVAAEGLAEFCDVFCEERVFTIEESRRVLEAARVLGLASRIHADQLTRGGGALLAAELKAKTADHLEHTDATGIAALRSAGVQPVLLPGSVYALGSARYPAAREMIEAGLAVVLATDFNPGSSPTPSMTMILSLASTHMKMTPAEALTAATVNAAYSLNRGERAGTLEAGKRADFVVHDCADYRELAYFFGVEHAHSVFVGGLEAFARASLGAR